MNKVEGKKKSIIIEEKKPQHKGEVLKAARIKQGLSLQFVHESTKIPMDALRAIEEDYTIRTLSSFYYKSFLKIYAKFLDVDIDAMAEIAAPKNTIPVEEELPQEIQFDLKEYLTKTFTRRRKEQIAVLLVIFFSFFLLFKLISFFMTRKPKARVQKKVQVVEDVKPTVQESDAKKEIQKVIKVVAPTKEAVKKKEVVKAPEPKKVEKKELVIVKPQIVKPQEKKVVVPIQTTQKVVPMVTVTQGVQDQSVAPIVKDVVLTVRAIKASWLRIAVDGDVVFQSTLRLGAVETWMADEKIEISGKNIGQLEFELNGKMIGSLGSKKRRIKSVIVTKDGLSVNK